MIQTLSTNIVSLLPEIQTLGEQGQGKVKENGGELLRKGISHGSHFQLFRLYVHVLSVKHIFLIQLQKKNIVN